jgi:hypothetical protein
MGVTIIRGLLIGGGALLALGGLALVAVDRSAIVPGAYAVVSGLVAVVAGLIERQRYRSAAAEETLHAPGPGGGEPLDAHLEPRFQPTEERFVDPSTRERMRVWLDRETGERRYRADA